MCSVTSGHASMLSRPRSCRFGYIHSIKRPVNTSTFCVISVHFFIQILQQQYVLAELGEHLTNCPVDATSTALVLCYLRVLNTLFEEGFLSHEVIRSVDSPTLLTMQSGFCFFVQWLESLIAQGT